MISEYDRFTKSLKEAVKIIAKWPKWKRDAAHSAMLPEEKRIRNDKSSKR